MIPKALKKDFEEAFDALRAQMLDNISAQLAQLPSDGSKETLAQSKALLEQSQEIEGITLEQWVIQLALPTVNTILGQKRQRTLKEAYANGEEKDGK